MRMIFHRVFMAAATTVALAGPVLASPCTDQIDAFEKQLADTARAAVATSSGGQAVAAARESQAIQPGGATPPFQSPQREAQATQQAAEAGGGGDRVMQAKSSLAQARVMAAQGNDAGCLNTLGRARQQAAP